MKKFIIIIYFLFLSFLSYSAHPFGTTKVFDCKDLNNGCEMKIYAKAELGTIYFYMED